MGRPARCDRPEASAAGASTGNEARYSPVPRGQYGVARSVEPKGICRVSPEPEIEGASIVVLGRFNPSIFSPAWLRHHNLIGAKDEEAAEITVIIPPAAVFSTGWLSLDVTEDRLVLLTTHSYEYDRLRDVATGILSLLDKTPISGLGINHEAHWSVASRFAYDRFGDALVPKEYWAERISLPGTQDLTVRGVRTDAWAGHVAVTVQPSSRLEQGIYARVNDHYMLKRVDRQPQSRDDFLRPEFHPAPIPPSEEAIPLALEILNEGWRDRLKFGSDLIWSLIKLSDS